MGDGGCSHWHSNLDDEFKWLPRLEPWKISLNVGVVYLKRPPPAPLILPTSIDLLCRLEENPYSPCLPLHLRRTANLPVERQSRTPNPKVLSIMHRAMNSAWAIIQSQGISVLSILSMNRCSSSAALLFVRPARDRVPWIRSEIIRNLIKIILAQGNHAFPLPFPRSPPLGLLNRLLGYTSPSFP